MEQTQKIKLEVLAIDGTMENLMKLSLKRFKKKCNGNFRGYSGAITEEGYKFVGIKKNVSPTSVEVESNLLSPGVYSMVPREIIKMFDRRVERDYGNSKNKISLH